jgi:hypothetical protein
VRRMAVPLQLGWTDVDYRIAVVPLTAIFLLTLASTSSGKPVVSGPAVVRPATPGRIDVRFLDLASIRRLVNALVRQQSTPSEGQRAAAWADFSLVSEAVIGDSHVGPFDPDELVRAATAGGGPHVRATAGVTIRDDVAYRLLARGSGTCAGGLQRWARVRAALRSWASGALRRDTRLREEGADPARGVALNLSILPRSTCTNL